MLRECLMKYPEHLELEYRRLLAGRIVKLAKEIIPQIRKKYKAQGVKTDASFLDELSRLLGEARGIIEPSEYVKNKLLSIFGHLGEWETKQLEGIFQRKDQTKLTIELAIAQVNQLRESDIMQNYAVNFAERNLELVRIAGNEYIEGIYKIAEQGYRNGESLKQVTARMKELTEGDIGKAEFWARDQIGDAAASYSQTAQKAVGVKRYRWRTMQDNRVRNTHEKLDGKIFDWEMGALKTRLLTKTGAKHPGEDYRCRCWAEPIFPGEE